jgi:hypothetical protein
MSQSVSKYLFSARQLGGYREIIRRHPVPGWISGYIPSHKNQAWSWGLPSPWMAAQLLCGVVESGG